VATLLQKITPPVDPGQILEALDARAAITAVSSDPGLVRRAVEARVEYGLHFYDCSGLASIAVSRELVHDLGVRACNDTNRVAFVAASPVAFGLARMYQIVSRGEERMQILAERARPSHG
jgi:hypothetical protein